jgi:glycosyltransferase involved in cell wall biosynthesis
MKIVILLATYNGEKYLDAQLKSILDQDYIDWILYISDDCSTDGTKLIIEYYCTQYSKKIFNIHNTTHFGNPRDNFFYLLNQVDADLYFFSDQDDVWYPNKISTLIGLYNTLTAEDKKKPLVIHSDLEIVNSKLETVAVSFFKYQYIKPQKDGIKPLLVQNIVHGCAMLINNELKKKINFKKITNDIRIRIEAHDWYFTLIAAEFGSIKYINKSLLKYRQHQNNYVGTKNFFNLNRVKNSFNEFKTYQTSMKRTVDYAFVLKSLYGDSLSSITKLVVNELINFYQKNKIERVWFLVHNNLLKHGFIRIVRQLIFA